MGWQDFPWPTDGATPPDMPAATGADIQAETETGTAGPVPDTGTDTAAPGPPDHQAAGEAEPPAYPTPDPMTPLQAAAIDGLYREIQAHQDGRRTPPEIPAAPRPLVFMDFRRYPELFRGLISEAEREFRTIEGQALAFISAALESRRGEGGEIG